MEYIGLVGLVIAAIVAILLSRLIVRIIEPEEIPAPNLTGLSKKVARIHAESCGLQIAVEEDVSESGAGMVWHQEPLPKKPIRRGNTVKVWIAYLRQPLS